jgi:hypothetical protein
MERYVTIRPRQSDRQRCIQGGAIYIKFKTKPRELSTDTCVWRKTIQMFMRRATWTPGDCDFSETGKGGG